VAARLTYAPASLIEHVGGRVPGGRDAIVFGERRVSWAELRQRVGAAAAVLAERGLGPRPATSALDTPHDHLGLMLENGPEYLELFLGASAAGATAFSVNTRYTAGEVAALLVRMDGRALAFSARLAPVVAEAMAMLPRPLDLLLCVGGPSSNVEGARSYDGVMERAAGLAPEQWPIPDGDRIVVCTGGTTGAPKGVVWGSEEFFVTAMRGHDLIGPGGPDADGPRAAIDRGLEELPPRSVCSTALVHFAAQALALQALVRGGAALIMPTDAGFDAAEMCRLISSERATDGMIIGDTLGVPVAEELGRKSGEMSGVG
jgi:3-oxocholest-4-en-26-oate---CoA ligase